MPKKLRDKQQNKVMWGLFNAWGFDREAIDELVYEVTNGRTTHTSKLYFDEANEVIKRLQGNPTSPLKTYRKADEVTSTHLDFMRRIWRQMPNRTNEGLKNLCKRMLKDENGKALDVPKTTKQCSQVIEAIKAMNKRAKQEAK
jgi:hypothetical protein